MNLRVVVREEQEMFDLNLYGLQLNKTVRSRVVTIVKSLFYDQKRALSQSSSVISSS